MDDDGDAPPVWELLEPASLILQYVARMDMHLGQAERGVIAEYVRFAAPEIDPEVTPTEIAWCAAQALHLNAAADDVEPAVRLFAEYAAAADVERLILAVHRVAVMEDEASADKVALASAVAKLLRVAYEAAEMSRRQ